MKTRYLTWRRAWPMTWTIGLSLAWHEDKTLCLMIHFMSWVLIVGPHHSREN